jgi:hypothetical protein
MLLARKEMREERQQPVPKKHSGETNVSFGT